MHQRIERLAESGKRSDRLIATFEDGYAANWKMAVKEAFRSQLDIKLTPRVDSRSQAIGKRAVKIWTQGPRIGFEKGSIFYDTPKGYNIWAEAIKHVRLACVVTDGKANDVKKIKSSEGETTLYQLIDGFVKFELLKPNEDGTELKKYGEKEMSQNDFLQFLKKGPGYGYHYNGKKRVQSRFAL